MGWLCFVPLYLSRKRAHTQLVRECPITVTDPDLRTGINVRERISTLKETSADGESIVELPPHALTCEGEMQRLAVRFSLSVFSKARASPLQTAVFPQQALAAAHRRTHCAGAWVSTAQHRKNFEETVWSGCGLFLSLWRTELFSCSKTNREDKYHGSMCANYRLGHPLKSAVNSVGPRAVSPAAKIHLERRGTVITFIFLQWFWEVWMLRYRVMTNFWGTECERERRWAREEGGWKQAWRRRERQREKGGERKRQMQRKPWHSAREQHICRTGERPPLRRFGPSAKTYVKRWAEFQSSNWELRGASKWFFVPVKRKKSGC